MPKFTFTTDDEKLDEAIEFKGTKAATDDAQVSMNEHARDKLPNGKDANYTIKVENEHGKEVYRAALNFEAKSEDEIEKENDEGGAPDVASKLVVGPRE